MENRKRYLSNVRSVVIKLGTQLLSDTQGRLDAAFVRHVAEQVAALRQRKIRVTLVSSGAIGAGLRELNLPARPTDLPTLQAVAAVGQRKLMDAWAAGFAPFELTVAQLLLTREDINHRSRYLNLRNTIAAVHELGAVPVINENDTISTDEITRITFGDNDILAGMVTNAVRADLLVLLTVVDGLLDGEGRPVRLVEKLEQARKLVRAEKSAQGKGGMDSKLQAAKMVTDSGEPMVVADGRMPNIVPRLLAGELLGTLFLPASSGRPSRMRWIGSVQPVGAIVIDDGAVKALVERNKSLLPAGIVRIEGHFHRGDVVAIMDDQGRSIARGLCNYPADVLERIRGKKTQQVRDELAEEAYDEVVHRDNLVVG